MKTAPPVVRERDLREQIRTLTNVYGWRTAFASRGLRARALECLFTARELPAAPQVGSEEVASALTISEIVIDPTIQIRRGNHEQTVRRYEESFDKLPPIDVFKTPDEGYLLADGFHRVAAAQRLGKRQIDAVVHRGSRDDALEFAVVSNTKNADPLSEEERD